MAAFEPTATQLRDFKIIAWNAAEMVSPKIGSLAGDGPSDGMGGLSVRMDGVLNVHFLRCVSPFGILREQALASSISSGPITSSDILAGPLPGGKFRPLKRSSRVAPPRSASGRTARSSTRRCRCGRSRPLNLADARASLGNNSSPGPCIVADLDYPAVALVFNETITAGDVSIFAVHDGKIMTSSFADPRSLGCRCLQLRLGVLRHGGEGVREPVDALRWVCVGHKRTFFLVCVETGTVRCTTQKPEVEATTTQTFQPQTLK